MIPVDPAMVGRDEHRPRRPERIEQAAEWASVMVRARTYSSLSQPWS